MVVCVSVLVLGGREQWTIELWYFEVSNMEPGPIDPRLGTFEPATMGFESLEARPPRTWKQGQVLLAGTVQLGSLEARLFWLWAMEPWTWELEHVDPGRIGPRDMDLGLGAIELMRAPELMGAPELMRAPELMGAPELTTAAGAMEGVLVGRHMANKDI